MGRESIVLKPQTQAALELMAANIRIARINYGWGTADLARRAGCSRNTVVNIEAGKASTSIGHVFNVAAALGLPLFYDDAPSLQRAARDRGQVAALMPRRIAPEVTVLDDF